MATRKVEIGPSGETARANIARIRRDRGITLRELSQQMSEGDRPLSYPTLSQIETGARRIDVDDLVALAIALDVSPNTLLIPQAENLDDEVTLTNAQSISLKDAWYFFMGMRSLHGRSGNIDFATNSLPAHLGRGARWSVSSARTQEPPVLSLQMETDGSTVKWRTGVGTASIFNDEDE
ncbi:helix-turn-helix domain-containing protein [Antrihabitans sp. YC2-6]|uniref:helix-turn-helix domain-containing protein n=1 Tax=Antrihabitans sp. YC2-6 TaxID=2799498 RepID=UPI0018F4895D|nr:helix-turn-helix transcriptional regulator [Antrihabitans sp. YC2-6]MBJ8344825.1 helix-turn-helix transcriptional regulator [Antrihabitans sp. YC2-6]